MYEKEILKLYASGSYGTPDAPIRSSSIKAAFWRVYLGHRSASEYKELNTYQAALAGKQASLAAKNK